MNTRALTAAALAGFLQPQLQTVNMVSAPAYAKERGIRVEETRREQHGAYESYIRLTVVTERQERSVAGTVFSDGKPRIIQIKGINMEAELGPHMLYVTNRDKPGFIGRLGTLLGERGPQHRDLPSRPPGGRRRRHRAGRDRRRRAGRDARRHPASSRASCRRGIWSFDRRRKSGIDVRGYKRLSSVGSKPMQPTFYVWAKWDDEAEVWYTAETQHPRADSSRRQTRWRSCASA